MTRPWSTDPPLGQMDDGQLDQVEEALAFERANRAERRMILAEHQAHRMRKRFHIVEDDA